MRPRLKLKHDKKWNEWVVIWLEFDLKKGWTRNETKSYYTDDKDDAIDTMIAMQKEIDLEFEAINA